MVKSQVEIEVNIVKGILYDNQRLTDDNYRLSEENKKLKEKISIISKASENYTITKEELQKLLYNYRKCLLLDVDNIKNMHMFENIICNDGFSFSAQANIHLSCEPKKQLAYWESMELCFPSEEEILLNPYLSGDRPLMDVYPCVPIQKIVDVINKHGGMKNINEFSLTSRTNTIQEITNWFKAAVPEPTDDHRRVQLGFHLVGMDHILSEIDIDNYGYNLSFYSADRNLTIDELGRKLKQGYVKYKSIPDKVAFADALANQMISAIGVCYMNGIDIEGALKEVNRSNWSKFVDGKPVFDENGKIKKGDSYTPPDLGKFVGGE